MTAPVRRVAPLLLIAVLAACASNVSPSTMATARSSPEPTLTPVPGAPSMTPEPTPPPTSIPDSNPAFGPVWNALPASWPTLPGQSESEIGTDASTILVVKGTPKALAARLETALKQLGWTVDVGSPLEDGSVVLDATREPVGCRAQAQLFGSHDGSNDGTEVVYYGAACPFD